MSIKRFHFARPHALILVVCTTSFDIGPAWAGDPEQRPIAELIAQLNDPRWCEREAASDDLIERGPSAYEPLKTAFVAGASYEVRRRIKEVVREIHMSKGGASSGAYLGIRMNTAPEACVAPEAEQATRVLSAVECSAAESAGIQADDIICSINGQILQFPGLRNWIQAQRPGTEGVLGVLRGARSVLIRSGDPTALTQLTKIETDVVEHASDPRVLPGSKALKIKTSINISPGVDVVAGDLIVGIDPGSTGESYSPTGRRSLEDWIASQRAGKPGQPKVAVANAGRGPRLASPTPCLYVVRGGQWLDLPFRLRRSPERMLPELDFGAQRMTDRLKAEAAFELWWQETFDPTGLVAENKSASDPSWKLTPKGKRG